MKTIEEAATRYACMTNGHPGYDPAIRKAFIEGAAHIMSLPLCDRLTSEEREQIKSLYLSQEEINGAETAFGDYPVVAAKITHNILVNIFGTAMFEEKGGEL